MINQRGYHVGQKQNDRSTKVAEKAGNADLPCVLPAEGAFVRHRTKAPIQNKPVDQIVGWDQKQPQPRREEDQHPYGK